MLLDRAFLCALCLTLFITNFTPLQHLHCKLFEANFYLIFIYIYTHTYSLSGTFSFEMLSRSKEYLSILLQAPALNGSWPFGSLPAVSDNFDLQLWIFTLVWLHFFYNSIQDFIPSVRPLLAGRTIQPPLTYEQTWFASHASSWGTHPLVVKGLKYWRM